MDRYSNRDEDETTTLLVVGWIVGEQRRAERLLSLTGLQPDAIRSGLTNPAILKAMLDFIIDHEPDLIACANDLHLDPGALVRIRDRLVDGALE